MKLLEDEMNEIEQKYFFGFTCLSDFADYFVNGEKYARSTFIAHNSKAYDNCLILNQLLESNGLFPRQVILDGRKVSIMKYGKKSQQKLFLDFYQYFPFPLASFHKTLRATRQI